MKVSIELRPFDALGILSFLREYFNGDNKNVKEFAAMHESVDAYQSEIFKKLTIEMLSEAETEWQVNNVCKRQPLPARNQ